MASLRCSGGTEQWAPLRGGAVGFLLTDAGLALLIEAVRAAAAGEGTVRTHPSAVQTELDARNRVEVAVWAWEAGQVASG